MSKNIFMETERRVDQTSMLHIRQNGHNKKRCTVTLLLEGHLSQSFTLDEKKYSTKSQETGYCSGQVNHFVKVVL